ncbi:VOC family protein [Anaerocolumna sp. AGMB13020]|uniref:VOC family protein n=1 Tax=Anaerocolumna sp. AGMB13020 TaxID=3081750 RepID=UPI00295306F8|nr:VOC family protein [Anaerocolumna sp. AGMB13020]WOO38123.1 VOC family protein [Anaerocolumna sp. AGMB13020]
MKFTLGHVLIKTNDFREAVKDFEKLGFTVTFGSCEEKATNALIYFSDESFLELYDANMGKLKPLVPFILNIAGLFDKARADRYRNYTSSGEGVNEYALDSNPKSDFHNNVQELRNRGYEISKNYSLKRIDLAGNELHWEMALSKDWHLPFFMSAYEPELPKDRRQLTHENGAVGIKRLAIAVDNLSHYEEKYNQIFGQGVKLGKGIFYHLGKQEIYIYPGSSYEIQEIWLLGNKDCRLEPYLTHGAKIFMTKE